MAKKSQRDLEDAELLEQVFHDVTPLPGRGTRPLRKGLALLATRVAERVTPSRSRPSRKGITAVPLELEAYHC